MYRAVPGEDRASHTGSSPVDRNKVNGRGHARVSHGQLPVRAVRGSSLSSGDVRCSGQAEHALHGTSNRMRRLQVLGTGPVSSAPYDAQAIRVRGRRGGVEEAKAMARASKFGLIRSHEMNRDQQARRPWESKSKLELNYM